MSAAPPAAPMPLAEPPCWYAVLGVAPDASAEAVRQAWRQAALRAHPDKAAAASASASSSASASASAGAHFLLVQQAWEVLQDPVLRAAYDRRRALHAARQQVAINETVEWEEMEAEGQRCHAWPCRCGGAFLLLDEDAQAAGGGTAEEEGAAAPPELVVPCSTCSLHIRVLLPPPGSAAAR